MIELSLVDAVKPALIANGFVHELGVFNNGPIGVEILREPGGYWWLVIFKDQDAISESKVDGITQILRILWAYGLIEWNWAKEEFQPA
jgi:hypothetical protein